MAIVNLISLESNKQIKINWINWNGGDLSSDGGLLLIKEFAARIGLVKLVKQLFKTNDRASFRFHTDTDNLIQVIYQIPLLKEYRMKYPAIPLYLRGDSDFASPDLYETCAEYDCKYAIRLKQNQTLIKYVADAEEALYRATRYNQIDYAVEYGEFDYQAGSWSHPRRVVFKIENPYGQMVHLYTFIVTTMESDPYQIVRFYCGRGNMENYIKEGKNGFDFSSVSSHSRAVSANRLQVHAFAYNLFNWFQRLALSASMRKQRVDTIRLKLLKIAAKAVRSARYIVFKLCSSCPYKCEFL